MLRNLNENAQMPTYKLMWKCWPGEMEQNKCWRTWGVRLELSLRRWKHRWGISQINELKQTWTSTLFYRWTGALLIASFGGGEFSAGSSISFPPAAACWSILGRDAEPDGRFIDAEQRKHVRHVFGQQALHLSSRQLQPSVYECVCKWVIVS